MENKDFVKFQTQLLETMNLFYTPFEALERFNKTIEFLQKYDEEKNKTIAHKCRS